MTIITTEPKNHKKFKLSNKRILMHYAISELKKTYNSIKKLFFPIKRKVWLKAAFFSIFAAGAALSTSAPFFVSIFNKIIFNPFSAKLSISSFPLPLIFLLFLPFSFLWMALRYSFGYAFIDFIRSGKAKASKSLRHHIKNSLRLSLLNIIIVISFLLFNLFFLSYFIGTVVFLGFFSSIIIFFIISLNLFFFYILNFVINNFVFIKLYSNKGRKSLSSVLLSQLRLVFRRFHHNAEFFLALLGISILFGLLRIAAIVALFILFIPLFLIYLALSYLLLSYFSSLLSYTILFFVSAIVFALFFYSYYVIVSPFKAFMLGYVYSFVNKLQKPISGKEKKEAKKKAKA